MKIRNGWVSNSSSSSFIVQLDKPVEEYSLKEFMETYNINPLEDKEASNLLRQLHYVANELDEYAVDVHVAIDSSYFTYDELNEIIMEQEKLLKDTLLDKIRQQHAQHRYKVEYGDHDPFNSYMEHTFMPNLPCTIEIINEH